MNTYAELVRALELLRDWRDSTKDKRKARAIQKVIDKKVPEYVPRDEFMYLYGLRAQDWRSNYLSVALRILRRESNES